MSAVDIRRVALPGTSIETSCLGFGCASLGSRIAPEAGLAALAAAHERGVRWFDVAPAYGAGAAEGILGQFLKGRRDGVQVCTKVGLAPPQHNGLMKLAYRIGRPLAAKSAKLRQRFRSVGATRNQKVPLTAELIETSITNSLRRLGTDRIDVYALHDPDPADVERDEILRTLEGLVKRGLARHISVAGTFDAACAALLHPLVFSLVQIADDPAMRPLDQLRHRGGSAFITHSVFGVGGARERMTAALSSRPEMAATLGGRGYSGASAAGDLLLDRAFASNPEGVVLASMFSRGNLERNASRAARAPDDSTIALVDKVLATAS